MLVILVFFGVLSTMLIGAFSVAVLNVVVRRESSYLIEERIRAIIENDARLNMNTSALKQMEGDGAAVSSFHLVSRYLSAVWPGNRTDIIAASERPKWLDADFFTGMVVDRGHLAIRSYREVERNESSIGILADTPVTGPFWRSCPEQPA
jgi:hypothetical protein